jgi:hypothetical protein
LREQQGMVRQLIRTSAAIAFAALLAPAVPEAAPAPGLQYDEIVRIVVNGSPPPPGQFQADLAAVHSATPVPVAQTPAPRRRGLGSLTNIAGAVLSGNPNAIAGAAAGAAAENAMEGAMQRAIGAQFAALGSALASFLQPHQYRYAYWNGWERIDDVGAQTATIRKCDIGQIVQLDLAHKTYTISTPQDELNATPVPRTERRSTSPQAPARPQEPGTGVVSFNSTTRALGNQTIEGQAAAGYDTTTTFAMSQATGSCRNGSATFRLVEYVPSIPQPTVNQCPLRRPPPIPEEPAQAVAPPSGGCRPTFSAQRNGPTPPSGRLALYTLMQMSGAQGATPAPGGGVGFLTERGNLKTLGGADAALFEIPQGFTKAP